MRVPCTLNVLHKELAVTAIVGLAVLGIATTSVHREQLYTGFMAIELSAMLRLRAQEPDRAYPAFAALRIPENSAQPQHATVLFPTARPAEYPLGRIRVRCGADAPSPLAPSRHRFAHGIREHCQLSLPPSAHEALAQSAQPIGAIDLHRRSWTREWASDANLLIGCRDLMPLRLARDPNSVDAWAKANCTFVPTWKP